MATKDVSAYLSEQQRRNTGELATEWNAIEDFHTRKLWHQLTLRIHTMVKHPTYAQGDLLVKMYQNFISDFDHRIAPLPFVEIICHVVKQIKDPKEAVEFLEKIKEKVKGNDEARILCLTTIGNIKLRQKEMDETKLIIQEVDGILSDIYGVTPVHGRFYELSSNYHKLMGNHADYYREALRYLGCMSLDDISASDKVQKAFNLALAAILGKGVYNFGELLGHPILESLQGSDKQWLVDLLYAFNSGNISKFEQLKPSWQTQPDLAQHELQMRQKISLLCLMEMTFKRPSKNRQLAFQEISVAAQLPEEEVELLVMKALALGLVKGSIDQVNRKVHMTWVQPRVLDKEQIATMQNKLQEWAQAVTEMEHLVENKAQDILTY